MIPICFNYEIRVNCCTKIKNDCFTTTSTPTTTTISTSTGTETTPSTTTSTETPTTTSTITTTTVSTSTGTETTPPTTTSTETPTTTSTITTTTISTSTGTETTPTTTSTETPTTTSTPTTTTVSTSTGTETTPSTTTSTETPTTTSTITTTTVSTSTGTETTPPTTTSTETPTTTSTITTTTVSTSTETETTPSTTTSTETPTTTSTITSTTVSTSTGTETTPPTTTSTETPTTTSTPTTTTISTSTGTETTPSTITSTETPTTTSTITTTTVSTSTGTETTPPTTTSTETPTTTSTITTTTVSTSTGTETTPPTTTSTETPTTTSTITTTTVSTSTGTETTPPTTTSTETPTTTSTITTTTVSTSTGTETTPPTTTSTETPTTTSTITTTTISTSTGTETTPTTTSTETPTTTSTPTTTTVSTSTGTETTPSTTTSTETPTTTSTITTTTVSTSTGTETTPPTTTSTETPTTTSTITTTTVSTSTETETTPSTTTSTETPTTTSTITSTTVSTSTGTETTPPTTTSTETPTTTSTPTTTTISTSTGTETTPSTITSTETPTTTSTITTTTAAAASLGRAPDSPLSSLCLATHCGFHRRHTPSNDCDPRDANQLYCANGLPPEEVYYKNGSCCTYKCPCVCNTWGDPHYKTFDGLYYTFQGNCTYVLFEEIIPKYNISVHVKNYYCNVQKHLACPEYVIVNYKSHKIQLTSNTTKIQVYVNDALIMPTYQVEDIIISTTDISVVVNITNIKAMILVSHLAVAVKLPFSYFHGNTEGLCGVCDNNTANDCRLPNGSIHTSCEQMADLWMVPPGCKPSVNITTNRSCLPETYSACELIKGKLFKKCHGVIPYQNYYEACKYDACALNNKSVACTSLDAYAQQCGLQSVCVDWKNSADLKGLCEYKCPKHKVYKACGPKIEKTCNKNCQKTFMEGCFCPDNTYLVSSTTDKCTSNCDCMGPDGLPRVDREGYKFKCTTGTCHEVNGSFVMTESIKTCPVFNPNDCVPGFEYVKKEGECCGTCTQVACIYDAPDNTRQTLKVGEVKSYTCETVTCHQINDSFISEKTIRECPYLSSQDCGPGFEYVIKEGECCGSCTQVACIYDAPDNTRQTLKDGEVQSYTCETVTCREFNGLFVTEKTKIECPYLSSLNCGPGFEYVKKEGECCGTCTQVACIYDAPDDTRHVLNDGKEYYFKCMNTTCLNRNGMFMTKESYKQCPPFNQDDCKPETVRYDKDGCCEICELSNCVRAKNVTCLYVNECTSIEDVEVTSCAGHCDDGSMYSMENDIMMRRVSAVKM
ncbi:hypothetical protein ABG768_017956 [Culter alburnus]|uniref:VWFD domain-containing protein n=1 Tax=Culter alburnus TaxID=194366 RepID=A0AAW1YU47_CULAL